MKEAAVTRFQKRPGFYAFLQAHATRKRQFAHLFPVVLAGILIVQGCGIPIWPIPTIKFAPETQPITEKPETPLVQAALKPGQEGGEITLAVRSGRVRAVTEHKTDRELLTSLPPADLKRELISTYIPPYKLKPLKAGKNHYYNFTITPEFEKATMFYLAGKGEEAIEQIHLILSNEANPVALRWQASYLKVQVLLMMGRPDLAEKETAQLERFELEAMKANHTSRAMRAEVRYWAGDLEGSAEDAAEVIRAFGGWRFPATFSTPPLDQVELARCTTAQVRANITLGLVLIAKGYHREALPWLELANQTMNNVMYTARHPITGLYFHPPQEVFWGRGMSLVALGNVLLAIDPNSKRAEETFTQAQEYFDALGFRAGAVVIETFKAHALSTAGQYAHAEEHAQKGVQLATQLGLLEYVWRLESMRGKALLEMGRTAEAERALRHAQSVVDLMAGTMVSDDAKVRFGVGKEGITQGLIRIDLKKNDVARLFEDMERGRARAFVALLANRLVAEGRERQTIAAVRSLDRQIQNERQRKNALSSTEGGEVDREHSLLEQRLALIAKLRERDPELADAFSVSAEDIRNVQKKLVPGDVMIYVLPGDANEWIRLLLITGEGAKLKSLEISQKSLRNRLREFENARKFKAGSPDDRGVAVVAKKKEADKAVVREKTVLAELQRDLKMNEWNVKRSAYIVPSGDFHFIPWGALDVDYPVAVLPTGGWLVRPDFEKKEYARASVVGDPDFGGLLPQLREARAEAAKIADRYGVKPLIGSGATEPALRQSVGAGVNVLHFATHALFDPYLPLQSALILSDGQKASPLTAERLFEKPLPSHLVVLSACETGMGKVVAGDDLVGLARSFYLGGAKTVLSSLWPVDDEATRLFMETFYDASADGDYGRAWMAARSRVKDRGYPPSIYGAFIIGGSLGKKY